MPDAEQTLVGLGAYVEVELMSRSGGRERLAFTLVADAQADFTAGFLGAGTPLAKAVWGQPAGAELPYPVADLRAVRVLLVRAQGQVPKEDVASRREAVERQAVDAAESINAMIFASAVNNKWGDYDPQGLDPTQRDANEDAQPGAAPRNKKSDK